MWEPILEGELAKRAWSVIDAIADALAELDEPADDLAVFWAYLATVRDDELTEQRAARSLERFAAAIGRGYPRLSLFEGLAGAGWAAAHVASDSEELLAVIDRKLIEALESGWQGPFDLIDGVAGFGVYFLERESDAAARGREIVVDYFASHAERAAAGLAWKTNPAFVAAETREAWPEGLFNCGVAHGVPGIVAVLARIAARADAPDRASELRDAGLDWLRAQTVDGHYPMYVLGGRRALARTAWCHGDPGVAVALHGLAPLPEWITRKFEDARVDDDGLCHGAAGLTHIANRLFQTTRDPAYRHASRELLEKLLAYRRPGEGVGGFGHGEDGARQAGILGGSAGVALALLAAVSDVEPAWDRKLLCSTT